MTTTAPTGTTPPAPSPSAPSPSARSTPVGAAPKQPRLRPGQLGPLVAEVLADDPGEDFTPTRLAARLGRSSGAVANALGRLTVTGHAEQTSTAPARYRATASTRAAATAPGPTTPGPTAPRSAASSSPAAASATPSTSTPTPAASGTGSRSKPSGGSASGGSAPAGSASSGPGEVVSGPVARPSGQMYHPRQLSGMPDVTALRRLRDAGVAALMYGPPGTGKTSVVEAAFGDLLTVAGDADTTVADLVGEYTQTPEGRFVFVHGPLVRAMREGRTLFIDDATLISPTVLAVVYPAMDGRRQIVIKANGGEVVDAAPGFYVVAGHNPGVHGAILTDALASRFAAQIHVSTDYDLAAALKIDRRAVKIARNLARRVTSGDIGWAPQLRELIAFDRIASVLGPDAAAGNLVGTAPEDDREIVAEVVRTVFGRAVTPLALGARI